MEPPALLRQYLPQIYGAAYPYAISCVHSQQQVAREALCGGVVHRLIPSELSSLHVRLVTLQQSCYHIIDVQQMITDHRDSCSGDDAKLVH